MLAQIIPRLLGNNDSISFWISELNLIAPHLGNRHAVILQALFRAREIVNLNPEVLDSALRTHLRLGQ
jgi:hypothetical protein